MDDILVFRTGVLGTWREKFAGVAAFARTADWRLQPVDARTARPDVRRLLSYWKPRGAIVDASGAPDRLRAADFGLRNLCGRAEGFRVLGRTQMHCLPEAGL